MSTYLDTGVLVKLYCPESDSAKAIETVTACRLPWIYTAWQELELANALRLKVFRKELTEAQRRTAMGRLVHDITSGVLVRTAVDAAAVFRIAETLSSQWTPSIGYRTLDILHVAAAKVIGARELVTFDQRQSVLAKRAGLKVRSGA